MAYKTSVKSLIILAETLLSRNELTHLDNDRAKVWLNNDEFTVFLNNQEGKRRDILVFTSEPVKTLYSQCAAVSTTQPQPMNIINTPHLSGSAAEYAWNAAESAKIVLTKLLTGKILSPLMVHGLHIGFACEDGTFTGTLTWETQHFNSLLVPPCDISLVVSYAKDVGLSKHERKSKQQTICQVTRTQPIGQVMQGVFELVRNTPLLRQILRDLISEVMSSSEDLSVDETQMAVAECSNAECGDSS